MHPLPGRPLLHMTTPHHLMHAHHTRRLRHTQPSAPHHPVPRLWQRDQRLTRHATWPTGPRSHASVADATLTHSRLAAAC
eukprot:scaffold141816_cov130-Phaeocystis_antarctica.AAC.1